MAPDGRLVGLWRHCEGPHLHTVPHTFSAADPGPANPGSFLPNVSVNVPFMAHAGAEDPMVYTLKTDSGATVL